MGEPAAKPTNHEFLLQKLNELPTLPTIVYELSQTINDPMSSVNDVEALMSQDQSLTTKVLRLINSAYYAIPGGVPQLSRAIAFLGFDTVNQLVLSASILKVLKVKNGPSKFDLNQFWTHAIGVGMAAETIGKTVKFKNTADLFTCGLVHDIGKIALCIIDPELVNQISNNAHEKDLTFNQSEIDLGAIQHTQVGHMLAKRWNLPLNIQNSILYHHQIDPLRRFGVTSDMGQMVDIVYLANLLINALKFGNSGHSKVVLPNPLVLERLEIEAEEVKKLVADIKINLASAEGFLKVIHGT